MSDELLTTESNKIFLLLESELIQTFISKTRNRFFELANCDFIAFDVFVVKYGKIGFYALSKDKKVAAGANIS
jgi:hypothetical protein